MSAMDNPSVAQVKLERKRIGMATQRDFINFL